MRRTLGTAVFGGMVGVTLFGIFLTPVFFNVIGWLGETKLFRSRFVLRTGELALAGLQLLALRPVTSRLRRRKQRV
jgi:multidrug efflux pump